jgi:hypothetical protein
MTTTGKNLAKYLREFDQVFDAEDMQILSAAFDRAWEAVQASGVIYPKDKVELVRAILAKHIIAAAKDGERDHSRLCDGASGRQRHAADALERMAAPLVGWQKW